MPSGGARAGAGQKEFWTLKRIRQLNQAVQRRIARSAAERQRRWERRHQRPFGDEIEEIEHNQERLKKISGAERANLLEEIQDAFAGSGDGDGNHVAGVPRGSRAPPPNSRDLGKIYDSVARIATRYFKRKVKRREVMRYVNRWRDFNDVLLTIQEIHEADLLIKIHCGACRHSSCTPPISLQYPPETDLWTLRRRLACPNCGVVNTTQDFPLSVRAKR